jgi:hypothetical protein
VLLAIWLLAIGVPFAIAPNTLSHIADRLRRQPQKRVSPRQARSARFAGIAIATLGALIVFAIQISQHAG